MYRTPGIHDDGMQHSGGTTHCDWNGGTSEETPVTVPLDNTKDSRLKNQSNGIRDVTTRRAATMLESRWPVTSSV